MADAGQHKHENSALTAEQTALKKASKNRGESTGEETRRRILDAAQSLFAAHGFSETTTKAIARRAGVPPGLIFYYFPSKRSLLESIIRERNILAELRAATSTLASSDPRTILIALGSCYLNVLQRHGEVAAILLREFQSHSIVARQFQDLHQIHIDLILSHLHKTVQPERSSHLPTIARIFFYNIIMISLVDGMPEPMPFLEEMVTVLLAGL